MVVGTGLKTHGSAEGFAWRVGRLRRLTGLSVREFAGFMGVDPDLVYGWENGTADPGPDRREGVMGALARVDPAALAAALPTASTLH